MHPSRVNPLVAYISEIYNTWGGGIEFNFKVAGTGFHAGALAFVRIPPNVSPQQFSSPTEWGAFEYVVMDPKTLEVLSIDVMDQRQLNFHFMKMDEKDPTSFGGYIACYVLIPLNTSSTGTQQIAIQAFARPGATFTMNQIIMPGIRSSEQPQPIELITAINTGLNALGRQTLGLCDTIELIDPNIQKYCNAYMRNFASQNYSNFVRNVDRGDVPIGTISSATSTRYEIEVRYNGIFAVPLGTFCMWQTSSPSAIGCVAQNVNWVKVPYSNTKFFTYKSSMLGAAAWSNGDPSSTANIAISNQGSWTNKEMNVSGLTDADYFTIPVAGESFLMFTNDSFVCWDGMLMSVYNNLISGVLTDLINESTVVLLDVVDRATGLNLFTTKLYFEGFMTVSKTIAPLKIIKPIRFIFNSYALRTSRIPVTPSQLTNSLMFSAFSKVSSAEIVEG